MYEKQTAETVRKRMLDAVKAGIDKREGSIIFDATAPVSIEIELLYAALDYYLKNTFADTADREFLIERAKERGVIPHKATKAVVKGRYEPITARVAVGARFSCEDLNYKVIEAKKDGYMLLECETAGRDGNRQDGRLIPIDFNMGLRIAEITEVTVPAVDDEDTEVFRERFLASFDLQSYGGNISDYKEKVGAISGVGGVKVYPVWDGGGTVKIVFCTSENKTPTAEFIAQVQEKIDPEPYRQKGVGIAPIGHYVTVAGTTDKAVNINIKISPRDGVTLEELKPTVERAIRDYLAGLNKGWRNTQTVTTKRFENTGLVVRIAHIESAILDVAGVLDVEGTTLNGSTRNLELGTDELAVLGAVNYG